MSLAEIDGQKYNPNAEKFADVIKNRVFLRQNGKSVITNRPFTEYHHRRGNKIPRCNSVDNCVGVDVVAHALIHFWQWEVSGIEDEWNAYLGQSQYFDDEQRKLFNKLKNDDGKSKPWKEGFVDEVEIMVRGRPNVHYI